MTTQTDDPKAELKALQTVAEVLASLDEPAVKRVLRWVADKFQVSHVLDERQVRVRDEKGNAGRDLLDDEGFKTLGELYAAASPNSDPERALLVGYWLQYHEGLEEFDSQTLNAQLKHMGHGITNVTAALTSLKNRKPQLVIQTRKSGTTRQARKKYKLTLAGRNAVEEMIATKE